MKYNIIENEIKYNDEIKNELNEIINNNYELKKNIVYKILNDLKKFNDINIYIKLIHELIENNYDNEFIENYIFNNYHIDINKKIMMINNYYENDLYDIIIIKNDVADPIDE